MRLKFLKLSAAALFTSVLCAMPIFAGQWEQLGDGTWKYKKDDGQYEVNCWQWIDGNRDGIAECYRFNENGILYVSADVDGYTVDGNGAWVVNGVVQTQQVPIPDAGPNNNNNTNNSNSTAAADGWYQSNGSWRYRMNSWDVTGTWRRIDGKKYYFDDMGNMVTGFYDVGSDYYYFGTDGALWTNTFLLDGVYYVIPDKDGAIMDEVSELDWWDYKRENEESSKSNKNSSSNNQNSSKNDYTDEEDRVDESDYAYEVFKIVNKERQKAGRGSLEWDDDIAGCTDIRAEELVELFSHDRPDGRSCFSVFDDEGVSKGWSGENIAMGQTTPKQVMESWMNSKGHRENILNKNFKKMGVGCYYSDGRYYWVQLFTD